MENTLNNELSEYLKLLRFKHKESQESLAKRLNITRNTYANWENNPISLSLATLIQIGVELNEDIIIFFKDFVAKSNRELKQKEE